jgi:hypothetical protein
VSGARQQGNAVSQVLVRAGGLLLPEDGQTAGNHALGTRLLRHSEMVTPRQKAT